MKLRKSKNPQIIQDRLLLLAIALVICSIVIAWGVYLYGNANTDTPQEQPIAEIKDREPTDEEIRQVEHQKALENKIRRENEQRRQEEEQEQKIIESKPQQIQTTIKSTGVNYYNGYRETWYSSQVARHYRINEWVQDENGYWKTQTGLFVVASQEYNQGAIISTSMGQAQVLDYCETPGVIDFYVSW